MPPETLPWERKDYSYRDHRKHEALAGGGMSSSFTPRWREAYHGPRDFPRASPRRPLPGHYRQGGFYHPAYSEDPGGFGCTHSRSDRFWPDDDSFRLSSSGRYGGGRSLGSRDNRRLFRRSPFWDSGDISRQHHEPHVSSPRSVTVPISSATQPPFKVQNDKIGGGIDDGLARGRRLYHRDRSSWKHSLKWSRPISSSSAKADKAHTEDAGSEAAAHPRKRIGSPVRSPQPSVDDPPKKNPRLGWGQGLAKFEKQKVENTSDFSESAVTGTLSETSAKISGPRPCLSPSTPCSAACNSSLEEKPGIQSLSCHDDMCYKSNSSGDLPDDIPIKLEHLGTNPITALNSVLSDLLQPDDVLSADLTFTRYSSMNKILMLKEDISKELEKTECEIDLLDNELKTLGCDAGNLPEIVTKSANSASEPCDVQCTVALNNSSNLDPPNKDSITDIESTKDSRLFCNSNKDSDLQIMNMAKVGPQALSSGENQSTSLVSDAFFKSLDEFSISLKVEMPGVIEVHQIRLTDIEERPLDACENEKVICSEAPNNSLSETWVTSTNTVSDLMMSVVVSNKNALKAPMNSVQTGRPHLDSWESVNFLSRRENDSKIREKLAFHKRLVKFKEKILAFKFRALHHLWKEDLRLLSLRKHRVKLNKRLEKGGRLWQSGYRKHRSSIISNFVLPGNTNLLPTTEIVNFATTLVSDSRTKLYRSNLKMPALILDEEGLHTRFVTYNAFIEDPLHFEKEKSMINPWSQEEKEVFMEMLVKYGKDFTNISSHLQHKTTADCIEFYYKNHKSEMFKEVKERLDLRKQQQQLPASTYLVTSGKKWNSEANATSVNLIVAPSSVALQNFVSAKSKQNYTGITVYEAYDDWEVSCGPYNCSDSINSIEELSHVRESLDICGALSSEALSSCVTNSTDPAGKICNIVVNPACKAEISQHFDEEDICLDEGFMMPHSTDWSDEEKSTFVRALITYGKDFTRISSCLKSRSGEQCKVFYSKARKCLGLDLIHHDTDCNVPLIEKHGGKSDMGDACGTGIDSAGCSIELCSKLDEAISYANTVGVAHGENILAV